MTEETNEKPKVYHMFDDIRQKVRKFYVYFNGDSMTKLEKKQYESNILRGSDLDDMVTAKIVEVNMVTFGEGTEKEAVRPQLTVEVDGIEEPKIFAIGMRQTKTLVDGFKSDETEDWVGKTIRLTPVASQTPEGKATTSIAITVPKIK
jgi:hypothetical protein